MDLVKFEKLFQDFQKINLKSFSIDPTFMDISGFPHYENVCSNILKFFFLTEEVHGLKDLFIQALFKTIEVEGNNNIIINEVIREQSTMKGNRLDLVIFSDDHVIGIENKIFAGVYNDLDDYSAYLNSVKGDRQLFKVILSIYSNPKNVLGFISIRYNAFFENIDSLMGNYWQDANQKYLTYLKDFMQTIRRIEGDSKMDNELSNFLNENLEEAEKLLKAFNDMKKNLRQRVQDLSARINYDETKCRQFFWRENDRLRDDLVYDIQVGDAVVAIDSNDYPVGWSICIWLRHPGNNCIRNQQELIDWLIEKGIPAEDISTIDQSKIVYSKKKLTTDETAVLLQNLLDKLCS